MMKSHANLTVLKWAILLPVSFLLSACGEGQGDDLDQFMNNAAKDMNMTVESLPQVLPYVPLQFNADTTLSDPFKARRVASKGSALQPNLNRTKEALELFPLESLKYVGTLSKKKEVFALVKTPDNTLQQTKIGNYIGPNFGLITQIDESAITLKEIVQDELTGDWVERVTTLNLLQE